MVAIRLYNTGDSWRTRVVTDSGTPLFTSEEYPASHNEALDAMSRGRALAQASEHVRTHNLLAGDTK